MNNTSFWTVFKADMLFAACTTTLTIIGTICIALYRKRKARLQKVATALFGAGQVAGPRAVIVGGREAVPGHCPLCGQGWPLPGPVVPPANPAVPPPEEKKPA